MGVRCPPNRQRTEGPSEQTAGFGQRRRPAGRGSDRSHDPAAQERGTGVTPYYDAGGVTCCTPEQAWSWLCAVAEMALSGDEDGLRVLPEAIEHYLKALR